MSHNELIAEIKKEDKKPKKIFCLVMLGSAVVGIISGFLAAFVEDSIAINDWINAGMKLLNQTSLYIGLVTGTIAALNLIGP